MKLKHKEKSSSNAGLVGVEAALYRAQQRACETALRTGTPLVIYRNGKIEKQMVPREKK